MTLPQPTVSLFQDRLAHRYRFERELGRSASTATWYAHDLASDFPVTLRLLFPPLDAERVTRELQAAARLEHPHVLPVLDAGSIDGVAGAAGVYYAVPYVSGESLRDRLAREGPLPVAESLRIAADVAGALAAAHGHGLVHRGLRPENILLSSGAGVAVLAGLGAGDVATDDTTYLSPEQLAGHPRVDGRSDVYSLGVVLYEMLAGVPPGDPVVPLRAGRRPVAEEVELLVAQALAPDPANRFKDAGALAETLSAAAATAGRPMFTTGERLAPRRRVSPRWTFFTALVVGLLAVSLWLRYTTEPASGPPPVPPPLNSIAVLPLVNASPDTANEYLSDGITGELIAALGTVPGLRVIGPSSSLAFKRSQLDGRQIGRRLGVGAVLEGSVRPAGDGIRVNANLVSVAQGFDLWTETYEVELTDLPSLQADLTRSVVRALRLRVPGGGTPPSQPATRLDAYRAFLAGRALSVRATEETVPAAIATLETAVGLDSAFAPAWAALAEARTREMLLDMRPTRDVAPLAREAAERALAFDSTLAGAHAALGLVLFLRDWEWAAAERAFQRAIALNPNLPEPQHWYSHLLTVLGRGEESLAASRRALELSPADPAMSAHLGWHHLMAGESEQADQALARAVALDPGSPNAHFHLALLSAARGDYASAEEHLARVPLPAATSPRVRAELGRVYALAGRTDGARGIRDELREAAVSGYVPAYELALVTLALGETGRAMALLESAAADRDASVVYLRVDPRWERLRDDRRFARVVRRLGLP